MQFLRVYTDLTLSTCFYREYRDEDTNENILNKNELTKWKEDSHIEYEYMSKPKTHRYLDY